MQTDPQTYQSLLRQWHEANAEGRFATADYLAAHLPPARGLRAPEDQRDRFAVRGEISSR